VVKLAFHQPEIEIPPNSDSNSTDSRQMVMASSQEFFAGPLPPPYIMQGYENILPGSADRILKMAEGEQSHRHAMESDDQKHFQQMVSIQVKTDSTLQNRGLYLGFALALTTILSGAILIGFGKDGAGFTLILGTVAGIGIAFIVALRGKNTALNDKNQENSQDSPTSS